VVLAQVFVPTWWSIRITAVSSVLKVFMPCLLLGTSVILVHYDCALWEPPNAGLQLRRAISLQAKMKKIT
jgi:hypothetical protein